MKSAAVAMMVSILAGSGELAIAADLAAGKAKAKQVCAACHGVDGKGKQPTYPNLAGQQIAYIKKQLNAFRKGDRIEPIMNPMAGPLTDADIDNLAAYYSSLGCK